MLLKLSKKILWLSLVSTTFTTFSLANLSVAKADMAKVRCDFYIRGEENIRESDVCDFFQRQGFIGLTKSDGTDYSFVPAYPIQPNAYEDGNGDRVIRQNNGEQGLVLTTQRESIYIYWDNNQSNNSQIEQPKTYTNVQDFQNIDIEITEGDFRFYGKLKRVSGDLFVGSDKQVNVTLNPYSGNVIVFNKITGNIFYNYNITPISGVGENSDTMCDPTTEPC